MFSEKKLNKTTRTQRNTIASTTIIIGNISSDGDFRIDGKVEGNIKTSGRLIIGQEGCVKGSVDCSNADIEGKMSGKLTCTNTLSLMASSVVEGEVFLEKLAVEPGATLNATCNMKSIKALSSDTTEEISEKSVS